MGWRLGSIEKQKLVVSPEPRRFGVVPLRRRAARRVERGVGGRGERLAQTRINGLTA